MSEDHDSAYELRQLRLMAERLAQFQSGDIPIARAIADLEGLLWALEERVPADWFDAFLEQWGELEVSYAVALDRDTPIPDATVPDIRLAIEEMIGLIRDRRPDGGVLGDEA